MELIEEFPIHDMRANINFILGLALLDKGDREGAATHLKDVLDDAPGSYWAGKVRELCSTRSISLGN